jgi:hypothetical protein
MYVGRRLRNMRVFDTSVHYGQYTEDCASHSGIHWHDCLCDNQDPECDDIPICILCGDNVF